MHGATSSPGIEREDGSVLTFLSSAHRDLFHAMGKASGGWRFLNCPNPKVTRLHSLVLGRLTSHHTGLGISFHVAGAHQLSGIMYNEQH